MTIGGLMEAIQTLNAADALHLRLDAGQWQWLGSFLVRQEVASGATLIRHLDMDRTMFLLESGTLQVYVPNPGPVRKPVAILRPGAVVGEAGLFGETPRMAQVDAMTPCVVWGLTRPRFDEFAGRTPALAIELMHGAGRVMAERMRANLERGLPNP
jgi:CRP-like cAMP-binding protein